MAGLGPMAGQLSWFIRVSNLADREARDYEYPLHRYRKEVLRLYGVLERALAGQEFICGAYSIADIASWTWVEQYNNHIGGLGDFPNITAWHRRIAERPAVQRGLKVWMPEPGNGWSAAGDAAQIAKAAAKAAAKAPR
jgi:glutathione S-transferase